MSGKTIYAKSLSLLLSLALVCGVFSLDTVSASAANGSSSDGRTVLSLDSGDIVFSNTGVTVGGQTVTQAAGEVGYLISQQSVSTPNTISVQSNIDILLQNVNIDTSNESGKCAFLISDNAAVSLTLDETSTLKSGENRAGIEVQGGSALTVTAGSTGTLNVFGGRYGAGIGGNGDDGASSGTITINGGTVTATGGDSQTPNAGGAGIGTGCGAGTCGDITINGGSVTARGRNYGAGIGGGAEGAGGNITINDGIVKAFGSMNSAGIGSSDNKGGRNVTIKGGTVMATGGDSGAGIGGGFAGKGGTVIISGGIVTANGGDDSAGIGGGEQGAGGTVTITGSGTQVTAKGNYGGKDIGAGGYTGSSGGSLTVGSTDMTTAPLPDVIFSANGTNATTSFNNCTIEGNGAGSQKGEYDENGKIKLCITLSEEPESAVLGDTVTLSASITKSGFTDQVSPSGIITFFCGSGQIGTASVMNGTAAISWTPSDTKSCSLSAGYTSSGSSDPYAAATSDSESYSVGKAALSVQTAPTASYLPYGSKLSDSNLSGGKMVNASGAAVAGTFAWANPNTAVTSSGNYDAVFTPDDAADYSTATVQINVTVTKAAPTVQTAPTASYLPYGSKLSDSNLSGGEMVNASGTSVAGTFAWANPDTAVTSSGNYDAVFTPGDAADYSTATVQVNVTVTKADLTVKTAPTASNLPYGSKLSSSKLSGGEMVNAGGAAVAGTFAWANPDTAVTSSGNYGAIFTPGDAANYNTATVQINVTVTKAAPTVQTAPTASYLPYGSKLSDSNLSGGEMVNAGGAAVAGTFAWANPDTVVTSSGNYGAIFTPGDAANYNTATVQVNVTVTKADPTVKTVPTAADIVYGSKLSSSKLSGGEMVNASGAAVAGTFAWANPDTAVTSSGNYGAIFTPGDAANYNTVSVTVPVQVTRPSPSPVPSLPSTISDAPSGASADLSGATFPAGVTSVSLSVTKPVGSDKRATNFRTVLLAGGNTDVISIPMVYNISLFDQDGAIIPSFGGTVTVRIPLPAGVRGTPKVFRYEQDTNTFTDMNAVVENGYLVFSTTHFSDYAVAGTGNSVTLDTKSYQMPVSGKYQIGVKLTGTKAAAVKYHSTSDKTAAVAKLKNGNYLVTGKSVGTVWIMFDVYDSKNRLLAHVSTRVDVKTGIRPRGDSTRQYVIF